MRQYVISNDAAKIREMAEAGQSPEEIIKNLAHIVAPAAVKAWIAGTPGLFAKKPAKPEAPKK